MGEKIAGTTSPLGGEIRSAGWRSTELPRRKAALRNQIGLGLAEPTLRPM